MSKGHVQRWIDDFVSRPMPVECVWWPFNRGQTGYARARNRRIGKMDYAHRVVWEAAHGVPFPAGLEARHMCGRGMQGCVNVDHIVPGTHLENAQDMITHGTQPRGSRNGSAVLTEEEVRIIWSLLKSGVSGPQIARRFQVNRKTIYHIMSGKNWSHITGKERKR